MTKKKAKQSLLVGALASSFGIFISKAIGLLYYSPLSSIAGESNMSFYSITYTYYDLLLKISSAGIPFAIAALVARYYAKEDYKTVLLVRKLGVSLVMGLTFVVAIAFALISAPLALNSMGGVHADPVDVENLLILFRILLIAVILVPYLSAIRGYYQGLKRLDLYASSQALEQFVRVFSILLFSYILVKVLSFDSIYAIFMAILAAGLAAFVTIFYVRHMTKSDDRNIEELIKQQQDEPVSSKIIIKELLSLGIPYLTISFIGSLPPLVNTSFYLPVTTANGVDYEYAKLCMGILQANCNKMSSIPQVLTLGFSAGLVPYLVESMEKKDYKTLSRQITLIIETVLYILIPVVFVFVFFSKDIYFIMYGNRNLQLGSDLLRIYNSVSFTDTLAPILSSMMITLKLRKQAFFIIMAGLVVKFGTFFPLVKMYDAYGMIYSSVLCSGLIIILYFLVLNHLFEINFPSVIRKTTLICLSSLVMCLPAAALNLLIGFNYLSRIKGLLIMGMLAIMMAVIYLVLTFIFKLPQEIFDISGLSPKTLLRKLRR